ncbi:MAG: helix-turn-helix transcriptional regulator [Verrucomicrobia bacterium]|nr:helix-turn-helix transcriptional regulator [Verrucomicrobiota bacterium]
MKLIYEKLTLGSEEGFTFKEVRTGHFTCPWHFHTENELILTLQFPGFRMIGDNITPLEPGDLVLVGSNLPHIWQLDARRGRRSLPVRILLVQFEEGFLGQDFWALPAVQPLRQLLKRAAVGLGFNGKTRERAAKLMTEMRAARGLRRMALFLSVLDTLSSSSECRPISSPGYSPQLSPFNQERMDRVFQFIHERLDQPLHLHEAARRAGLSAGAFSRFFRLHSGRTFPEFVNELRVGRACRLLAEADRKITDIAFACGFNNLSNFNRQFRRLKRMTPREFERRLRGAS